MKQRLIITVILVCMALTGCTTVYDLTTEESDLIAEYAAGVLTNYSYDNKKEYVELMQYLAGRETETEASVSVDSSNTVEVIDPMETDASGEISDTQTGNTSNMAAVLGLENIEVTCLGYEVTDTYPKEEFALSTSATDGHKLVVVQYELMNLSSEKAVIDLPDGITVKAVINNTSTVTSYATLLNQDILNMDGKELLPGEAATGVFVFNVKEELCENIASLNVIAK